MIQVPTLRACELCDHHRHLGGTLHCDCPAVAGARQLVPCEEARFHPCGACGRDAQHQQWQLVAMPSRRAAPELWADAA